MKKNILFFICMQLIGTGSWAQRSAVSGTVTEGGRPLPGATVSVKGTTIAAITDADGAYSITAPDNAVLVFRFMGFRPQEISVGSQATLNVELEVENMSLEEVVVSAGGICRARREQGYSTTKVTAKELTVGKPASLAGGLTAKVPGLQVNAVSSGVNPNYRLVLRGNRSITGNNQALVVVDNAIVSSDFLNNINPETIADIQVLNGAAGATLYGSEASNGVLLITTKSGVKGKPRIQASHTLTFEQVSFFPKLQNRFGQGKTEDGQVFEPIENQQYGPPFDGSLRDLGYPLANGEQQQVAYEARDDREKFWETGVQNQTDLSVSFGSDRSTAYIAAQYFTAVGVMPGDRYNRASVRLNNAYSLLPNLSLSYSAGYVENNYDVTTATDDVYEQLLNIPANVPLLRYKDWENDKWSDREGWYCPYYNNPYYTAANYRGATKNTYLSGKAELKWDITPWLSALYRASISNRYYQVKNSYPKSTLSSYAQEVQKKENLTGGVYDAQVNTYRVNHDFQLSVNKTVERFFFNLTLGAANALSSGKETSIEAALLIPGLYNVGNRSADPGVSSVVEQSRSYGVWGDLVVGYNRYLFLHLTGRNDWTSLLSPKNRSYFYPSTDLSFIPTDAFSALKGGGVLSYWKVRAAASQTGNVNIAPYSLEPVYGSSSGWSSGTYFSESGVLVSNDLKPEITLGYELGTELRLLGNRAEVELTYYYTGTTNQTILATIAQSSGYSGYLLNTGKVTNSGVETALRLNPLRTGEWNLHLGMNYTHNKNLLEALHPDTKRISVNGSTVIYAEEGKEMNQLIVTDYKRDPNGRVIVDINTGYPSIATETASAGNTTPKHRLGLDFALQWRNITVSSVFEYRGGYYYIFSGGWALDFSGASARSAYYNRERFVFPNSSYLDPASGQYVENTSVTVSDGGAGFWVNSTFNTDVNSNYVYSGDYWKWRELSVSYSVPQGVLGKLGATFSEVTLSVQGRNLFLWTPESNEYTDPDLSANGTSNAIGVSNLSSSPPTRYFGGSLSLTF